MNTNEPTRVNVAAVPKTCVVKVLYASTIQGLPRCARIHGLVMTVYAKTADDAARELERFGWQKLESGEWSMAT